ncbi:target of Myb protein 1-like [Quillaja saponaria]|uniref:Target of Myb protein 1-like n=1 Tax=Quillaja saponaria TaxID=32244 RepID=A0AAD7L1Z8_QUISA|nr:target of Myb protein 1-like [Quillaja saponaria]
MASSSSATVAVEKATSDLLFSPDWTLNIAICDSINSNHWLAKDVVKAVKKRLQHKSPKVLSLSLTLLETMVKNCGDYTHLQIAEKNILGEMIKIVKKKEDMQVRNKILVLLVSWQEAFGGPGGKHPQYYWAYEELKRSGVVFPKCSSNAALIFTPPITHPTVRPNQAGYGMPSNSSSLDETMATKIESLSLSSLDSMRDVMDLLNDMLQAVNHNDKEALKDEVIVDLVCRCCANQKKLMQMLTTTGDEELLGEGLELNDSIQSLLAKHDAIASGFPFPTEGESFRTHPAEVGSSSFSPTEVRNSSPGDSTPNADHSAQVPSATTGWIDEEEEDEFAQLARRHSKTQPNSEDAGSSEGSVSTIPRSTATSYAPAPSTSVPSNALAVPDPPAPIRTTKEENMIDLLSIALSTTSVSPHTNLTTSGSSHNIHQVPVSPSMQGYPYPSQTYPGSQVQVTYNDYVAPWAQHQTFPESHSRPEPQPQPQPQLQSQPLHQQPYQQPQQLQTQQPQQFHPQPQPQPHQQSQPPQHPNDQQQLQPQTQSELQNQYPQYPSQYPPLPWAATPSYSATNTFLTPRAHNTEYNTPVQGALQHYNSFPSSGINVPENSGNATAQKPFVPSYRLFEDLNVFGDDGRLKTTSSSASSSFSGAMGPGMVGGRK